MSRRGQWHHGRGQALKHYSMQEVFLLQDKTVHENLVLCCCIGDEGGG